MNGSGTSNINFSIGTGTTAEANQLGKIWVGGIPVMVAVNLAEHGEFYELDTCLRRASRSGFQGISREDARAVEQVLIEYNGLGKNGGSLLNKINSIATTNPIYASALARGRSLLQSVGYPGFK